MKTKLSVLLISASLLLVACNQETTKTHEPSDLVKIEKSLPREYQGLHIEMESYLLEETLTVKTVIKNQSEQEIPLHYETNHFASISLATEEKVVQEVVLPFDQDSLKAKEEVVFETSYILPNVDQEYVVKAHVYLEDKEQWRYKKEELTAVEAVRKEKSQELVFLPKEKVTYVYENKRNEAITKKEVTFLHFKDGFVQSVDTALGTTIYYVDQKGIYTAYKHDRVMEKNLIGNVDYNKQLVLSFPIKQGTNWELEGVRYEITALDQTVVTPFEAFHDVIEVTSDFGTGMKYFYQKDIGLLKVQVKNGDKWETTTELVEKK